MLITHLRRVKRKGMHRVAVIFSEYKRNEIAFLSRVRSYKQIVTVLQALGELITEMNGE